MNESDNPNNEAFIEPTDSANSPQLQASCPFYSVLPDQNKPIRQLPPARSIEDVVRQDWVFEPDIEAEAFIDSEENEQFREEDPPHKDWVAEPDRQKQAIINAEFQQLLTLNEELRFANDNLYEQVENLKQALIESEKSLQWQKKRSSVTESMLHQQNQELAAAGEQIKTLFQQLDTSVQTVQRQETLIESYRAQLEHSQQRLAQLERECTLIQTSYNEQANQVFQSENACRELRTRLMRQQRQTLQFKSALEKCLETPVPKGDCLDDSLNCQADTFSQLGSSKSLFTAQPIQPWSTENDDLHHTGQPSEVADNPLRDWQFFDEAPPLESTSDDSGASQSSQPDLEAVENTAPEEATSPPLPNIEEQLDSVIQMFFASQTSPLAELPTQKDNKSDTWETVATSFVDDGEPVIPTSPHIETQTNQSSQTETVDYWSDVPQVPPFEFTPADADAAPGDDDANAISPSPLIYPNRPPKGRKSLSSVELPNFQKPTVVSDL
ncbi:MAG: hypothetical protein KME60_20785 [Cyanomargarita calcarea GSE-NOS-MK-12-04C]|jgi:hypothetical protein|uniref:Uncharacterized protein n=1 Tax=Cyanomargarita calcarea GSE-NOS-MK-12-04C TaxID=2839659 RepID=A0A951UWA7_9CYAN|nr:hypothetical protein [Cyanomargarita calcarea GSE-NOS-MK-12-04C]